MVNIMLNIMLNSLSINRKVSLGSVSTQEVFEFHQGPFTLCCTFNPISKLIYITVMAFCTPSKAQREACHYTKKSFISCTKSQFQSCHLLLSVYKSKWVVPLPSKACSLAQKLFQIIVIQDTEAFPFARAMNLSQPQVLAIFGVVQ